LTLRCTLTWFAVCRPFQFGLATLLLSLAAPLGGVLSFRKFGLINLLPESLHGAVKYAHRKVRAQYARGRGRHRRKCA